MTRILGYTRTLSIDREIGGENTDLLWRLGGDSLQFRSVAARDQHTSASID
jgi:hypothetical protein